MAFLAGFVIPLGVLFSSAFEVRLLFTVAAFIVGAFTELNTRVDASGVSWKFLLGWPNWHVSLSDIDTVEVTTTNFWLEGYGIHWTIWHGWLWNVSGYGAVIIRTRRGGRITIGTNDPQGFYQAIERARGGG